MLSIVFARQSVPQLSGLPLEWRKTTNQDGVREDVEGTMRDAGSNLKL